jgi:hypothetical protein
MHSVIADAKQSPTDIVCCVLLLHLQVVSVPIMGKMAGAVGNYNAHMSAYADVDWQEVAEKFVTGARCGFRGSGRGGWVLVRVGGGLWWVNWACSGSVEALWKVIRGFWMCLMPLGCGWGDVSAYADVD